MSAIRILETLLKQALLPVTHCEGSLFYQDRPEPDVKIPDGFELRLGFFQALYLTQQGLTLNLQTTLTKFYPYMDILDFLTVNLRKDVRKNGMTQGDYEKARQVLNGCKISTRQSNYTQVNNNTITVRSLTWLSFADLSNTQLFRYSRTWKLWFHKGDRRQRREADIHHSIQSDSVFPARAKHYYRISEIALSAMLLLTRSTQSETTANGSVSHRSVARMWTRGLFVMQCTKSSSTIIIILVGQWATWTSESFDTEARATLPWHHGLTSIVQLPCTSNVASL